MCYRWTFVPVLPSMPWARPQAAGCVGSRGSDCQDGHRGAEVIAVQGDREGGKSQMHSRTCLTLDAVGTPTGCRLRREPWIRLSGRPSRERSPCGARSGEGESHRCTLVPVLPSMPWARPQAAGCAGSHGSDCQDGHRGLEAAAVQGMGRGKITDGLSYPFCPRCRPWPSPAE